MPRSVSFAEITDETTFGEPQKLINTESDVETFSTSVAYARITAFISFLSGAMPDTSLTRPPVASPAIDRILHVLATCEKLMDECPPHTGARRFGNLAFREWHNHLNAQARELISRVLPEARQSSLVEVLPYFLGSFGSAQRLDYGTGHELSFMEFICCLYQLGTLSTDAKQDALGIGLLVYPAYLRIVQTLIVRYTLEPAGSHGVWGLDDHFAMPYLLGSAQLSHIEPTMPPTPASITSAREVKDWRAENLYFNAIGFINDVKKGPFWEHSPMLYDISGIDNWAKISLGMRKMYNVEVLGKFPVVQHFPFGPVFFPFSAQEPSAGISSSDVENESAATTSSIDKKLSRNDQATDATKMPPPSVIPPTSVPWKSHQAQVPTAAPWASGTSRHSSNGLHNSVNQMSSSRSPQTMRPVSANQLPIPEQDSSTLMTSSHAGRASGVEEEEANTKGLEDGIGVDGMPGTKAPFAGTRTIHPAVLASMQARGDSVA